jgi:hypothetical protein
MSDREDTSRERDEAARERDEAARSRDERSRDRDEALEQSSLKRQARTKFEGKLFVFQIVANIVVLGALLILMLVATIRISDINQRQLDAVKNQNTAQLCAQHDIVDAVKKIGRSLGLPTDDIVPMFGLTVLMP